MTFTCLHVRPRPLSEAQIRYGEEDVAHIVPPRYGAIGGPEGEELTGGRYPQEQIAGRCERAVQWDVEGTLPDDLAACHAEGNDCACLVADDNGVVQKGRSAGQRAGAGEFPRLLPVPV